MTTLKVVAMHAALYLVTYLTLDIVEDHLTSSGAVALAILGFSVPLSFLANLWAIGDKVRPGRARVLSAALLTGLISPFSAMVWLTLYVNVVGYES